MAFWGTEFILMIFPAPSSDSWFTTSVQTGKMM